MRNLSFTRSDSGTTGASTSGRSGGGFFRRTFGRSMMSKRTKSQKQPFPPSPVGVGASPQLGRQQDMASNKDTAAAASTGVAQVQQPLIVSNNGNGKRRSTFGSRLSVHSLFFPSAYSTPVGGATSSVPVTVSPTNTTPAGPNGTNTLPASTTTTTATITKPNSKDCGNRPSKMSRSTDDLQAPSPVMAQISDDPDAAVAVSNVGRMNRSGSTERLLVGGNKYDGKNRVTVVVDGGKASSLAPSRESPASRSGSASDQDQDSVANYSTITVASTSGGVSGAMGKVKLRECPLCLARQPSMNFPRLSYCHHRSCQTCLVQYLHMEILESRVNVTCPECNEPMHPNDIYKILSAEDPNSNLTAQRQHLIEKYEEFSVRRVLMSDPDTRWCPAPDCGYAVIATGCAACPELRCQRPGCGALFCYHCKMTWHPNQTCDEARAQRGSFATSPIHIDTTIRPGDIKACPRCRTYIVKMNDGSCNHMICALCGAEFCWLCLREISDLHYLSPSGCTFWGKKPWSRKKKLLWQLGMLVGAPVGIALVAGLAVPAIIFGVPVWVGRKVHQKLKDSSKAKRRLAIAGSVFGSVLMSPVLASMAVGVGVPILLAYVYGVVPLSLCRNGSCGVTASSSGVRLDLDDEIMAMTGGPMESSGVNEKAQLLKDADKQDASTVTGFSMQSGSTQHKLQIQADVCSTGTGGILMGGLMSNSKQRRSSMESGATASLCGDRCFINYEEASTKALAGSTYCDDKSVHTVGSLLEGGGGISYYVEADQTSTKGLNGSVSGAGVETKSSKSISSGAAQGQSSSTANGDNASVVAMAGSICGVIVDAPGSSSSTSADPAQCSRCGGRRSSLSALRTSSHHHQHHHVHIDDQFVVDEQERVEREGSATRHHSMEPRVTRFADDLYTAESAEMSLLDRHYGILPIDEESNVNTVSTASKSQMDDQTPSVSIRSSGPYLAHRQSMEKSSSLRRFLFLRTGGTSTEDCGKRKRSSTSIENEPSAGSATTALSTAGINLKCLGTTSTSAVNNSDYTSSEQRRCRLHRDECQCDDAEFLLLPPDAYIVQHHRFPSTVFTNTSRRLSASSGNGRMKKSRSWSALLLDSGNSGQTMTSSIAAELWSTVRGAFAGYSSETTDPETGYPHKYTGKNNKRTNLGSGLVHRLRPGRRATVSTSVANVSTASKRANVEKKPSKLDVASSCTSLPETYSSGPVSTSLATGTDMSSGGAVSLVLPTIRQRTPSGSSPSKTTTSTAGSKRLSSTLVSFFKPSSEK